jgi:hypothetical protein
MIDVRIMMCGVKCPSGYEEMVKAAVFALSPKNVNC